MDSTKMTTSQKILRTFQQCAVLIEIPKGDNYPGPIGTGFFINNTSDENIFYFFMTNHNFWRYHDKDKEGKYKGGLYAKNKNINMDEVRKRISDYFIYFPEYDDKDEFIGVGEMPLPPFFIESLIIPTCGENFGDKDSNKLNEDDFCILKIDFNINKEKEKYNEISDELKSKIKKLSYSKFSDNEKIESIVKNKYTVSVTGFPIEERNTDLDYNAYECKMHFRYSTAFVEIDGLERNSFLKLNKLRKKNGDTYKDFTTEMNGLSGSPLLYNSNNQPIVLGMLILGGDLDSPYAGTAYAISINHLLMRIKDTQYVTEIKNPSFININHSLN